MDGSLRPMAYGVAFWGVVTAAIAWTLVQRHGVAVKTA
jgi:DHA1 family bicyclomycin/chloramphenicol resistance-like MFS transporter